MTKLVILPAARADLSNIGDFIALDNRPRAASFVAVLAAKIIEVGGCFKGREIYLACSTRVNLKQKFVSILRASSRLQLA